MKYIFWGTPEFSVIILGKLINAGFIPQAVVCNPDKPVGRKKNITPPPVKQLLIEKFKDLKIKILQPEKLSIQNIYTGCDRNDYIYKNNWDLFIVAAYSQILPKEILKIPRLGTIGVHPSLLPKYRGPSPIQTVILNGDAKTGTTLYLMDEKMDHGPILKQRELNYELRIMNYELLTQKLAELSADLLIEFFKKNDSISNRQSAISNLAMPQDETQATYTKKFKTEDAFIKPEDLEKARDNLTDSSRIAIEIDRKIRALNPEPGTWTLQQVPAKDAAFSEARQGRQGKSKRMKILEAILTPGGKLKLKKIQFESKKPINL